jgi:hypothetical protein
MELIGLMPRSSNYTFLTRLTQAGSEPLFAIYKPESGESPLWDFPPGTLYRREVAAYRLAGALGWPRVPATVVRENAPHGVGAVQLFIDSVPGRHFLRQPGDPVKTWAEVAFFDFLVNNADRKAGHCLVDAGGRAWMVDHGLTFHPEPKLRTVIWDYAAQPLPTMLRADTERMADDLAQGSLGGELEELLSRRELLALRRRLSAGLSPAWCFPEPSSGWSVPWPPV